MTLSTIPESAYVGGPMTNLPNFNFDVFDAVAVVGRELGIDIRNPHEHDQELYPTIDEAEATKVGNVQALAEEIGFSFAGAMTWDLGQVIEVEAIILLPGWEKSTGARFERAAAEACGKTVILATFDGDEWDLTEDPDQKQVTGFLATFPNGPNVTVLPAEAYAEVVGSTLTAHELIDELKRAIPSKAADIERVRSVLA